MNALKTDDFSTTAAGLGVSAERTGARKAQAVQLAGYNIRCIVVDIIVL